MNDCLQRGGNNPFTSFVLQKKIYLSLVFHCQPVIFSWFQCVSLCIITLYTNMFLSVCTYTPAFHAHTRHWADLFVRPQKRVCVFIDFAADRCKSQSFPIGGGSSREWGPRLYIITHSVPHTHRQLSPSWWSTSRACRMSRRHKSLWLDVRKMQFCNDRRMERNSQKTLDQDGNRLLLAKRISIQSVVASTRWYILKKDDQMPPLLVCCGCALIRVLRDISFS